MKSVCSVLVVGALLMSPSFAAAANEATSFVYPVGKQNLPPTEQSGNSNGFVITQNFNTDSLWEGGGANGGWCENASGQDNRYQSKTSCIAAGEAWKYGHTGVDLGDGSCGDEIRAIANGVVEFSGGYPGYGYLLKIKHTLPNGRVIYSIYGHRQSLMMSAAKLSPKGRLLVMLVTRPG